MKIEDKEYRKAFKLKIKNDHNIDLSEDQITLGILEEEKKRCSIFHGQLWPNKRNIKVGDNFEERITWSKTIDGLRAQAHRHGLSGIDEPIFKEDNEGNPIECRVAVYKGFKKDKYVGVARFEEFAQYFFDKKAREKKLQSQWKDAPFNQLHIAAERQALRKGFPDLDDDEYEVYDADEPTPGDADANDPVEPVRAAGAVADKMKAEPKRIDYKTGAKKYFDVGDMYSEEERVISAATIKDNVQVYILDSGFIIKFKDGEELARKQRPEEDSPIGGINWSKDSRYYDGSRVIDVKISEHKKVALLELDSCFKVKLDRWGKEVARKPLEEVAKERLENFDEKQALKKEVFDLHSKYCQSLGKKISLKETLYRLEGVDLGDEKLTESDMKILKESLLEYLDGKAS